MGKPRTDVASCLHCREKIYWRVAKPTPRQEDGNRRHWFSKPDWFHKEDPTRGDPDFDEADDRYCPSTLQILSQTGWRGTEYKTFSGKVAEPREFCNEFLKDKDERCHKAVSEESDPDQPMCGIHWGMYRREKEDRERREQEAELNAWVREESFKKREAERKEREEKARVAREEAEKKARERKEEIDRKIGILKDFGVDVEIFQDRSELPRSWGGTPNHTGPTKVVCDLDALVSALEGKVG